VIYAILQIYRSYLLIAGIKDKGKNKMSKKPTIRILVDDTVPSAKGKAIRSSLRDVIVSPATKIIELETLILGDRIIESFNAIKNILSRLPVDEKIKVENVSFTLCIGSTGEISLLSAFNTKAQSQVGITFTVSIKN